MTSFTLTNRSESGNAWLFIKVSAFTLIVPGSAVVLAPYLLLPDVSLGAIDVYGMSPLGIPLILLGAALYLRCVYDFVLWGRGTPAPIDAPVQLVTRGPYRYSRNPMYIGVLTILVGESLLYSHLPLVYFLSGMAVFFQISIVGYEERALRRRFGETYNHYCETVRRWTPGWSGLTALFKETFLKVGSFVLMAGVIVHVIRLSVGMPMSETPTAVHTLLVVLPGYAVVGLIVYSRQLDLAGILRKVIFALIIGLFLITVVMHVYSMVASDNEWYDTFPMWYSVLAVIVYGVFAYFLKTRTLLDG